MGIFDKAKDLASSNPDQVDQIVDKAGDTVDEKTGGKYAGQVDQGQDFVRDQLGTDTPPPAPEGEQPPR